MRFVTWTRSEMRVTLGVLCTRSIEAAARDAVGKPRHLDHFKRQVFISPVARSRVPPVQGDRLVHSCETKILVTVATEAAAQNAANVHILELPQDLPSSCVIQDRNTVPGCGAQRMAVAREAACGDRPHAGPQLFIVLELVQPAKGSPLLDSAVRLQQTLLCNCHRCRSCCHSCHSISFALAILPCVFVERQGDSVPPQTTARARAAWGGVHPGREIRHVKEIEQRAWVPTDGAVAKLGRAGPDSRLPTTRIVSQFERRELRACPRTRTALSSSWHSH